jgi:hypothetical protein
LYVNLDEILALIKEDLTIKIVESKSQRDVTTETLLSLAVNSELLEILIPSTLVQQLIRTENDLEKKHLIESLRPLVDEEDSETQEDKTIPRVEIKVPEESESEDSFEELSEYSDSESEVTMVRVGVPPIHSAVSGSSIEFTGEDSIPEQSEIPLEKVPVQTIDPSTTEHIDIQEVDSQKPTIVLPFDEGASTKEETISISSSPTKSLSKSEELKAKLEAMKSRFKR